MKMLSAKVSFLKRNLIKRKSFLSGDTSLNEYATAEEDDNAVNDGINQDPIVREKRILRRKSEAANAKHSENFAVPNSSAIAHENTGITNNFNVAPSPGNVSETSGATYILSSDSINATRYNKLAYQFSVILVTLFDGSMKESLIIIIFIEFLPKTG